MDGSEDRGVHGTDLRAREGAIFVYKELPKWFFVAQLETLEVDDWGIKATVLPLPSVGLSCPPQAFVGLIVTWIPLLHALIYNTTLSKRMSGEIPSVLRWSVG
jgi:hypothetical protein